MQLIRSYIQFAELAVEYNLTRAGVNVRDERGAISTEMAVVIAALVAIAVAAGDHAPHPWLRPWVLLLRWVAPPILLVMAGFIAVDTWGKLVGLVAG